MTHQTSNKPHPNTKHGESSRSGRSVELAAFKDAKTRCNNPNYKESRYYSERGIGFRLESVTAMIAEIGRRPSAKHSLDRIDVNGHYELGNIQWATQSHQSRNRRDRKPLTAQGQTLLLCEWEPIVHIPVKTLSQRRRRGWCDECVVGIPYPPAWHAGCKHKT